MRRPGIEPGASRWQRDILPLNQRRSHTHNIKHTIQQQPRTHTKQQTLSSTLLISHFAAFDQLSDSSHDQPLSVSRRQISVSRRQISVSHILIHSLLTSDNRSSPQSLYRFVNIIRPDNTVAFLPTRRCSSHTRPPLFDI